MYQTYLNKIAQIYQTGDYTEHSFRAPFQELLEAFATREIGRDLKIIHEASRQHFGAPDFKIRNAAGNVIGYIECKKIDEDIEKLVQSDQIKKYLEVSDNFILTNYIDFLFFRNGTIVSDCQITRKLRLNDKKPEFKDTERFQNMFLSFFSQNPEPIRNSKELSAELAKRTRILRDLIYAVLEKEERNPFQKLFPVFRKTVMPDLDKFTYADIYAETIGFGLFFLRLSRNQPLTKENILSGIPHYIPLLRDFFPNTRFDEWQDDVVWMLDEIIELLNHIDSEFIRDSLSYKKLSLLNPRDANLKDPFIYFYEEFLSIYDRNRKIEKGVFYTPEAVVSYIIRSLDMVLRKKLGIKSGFLDTSVKVLDFAAGTGTFIITLIEYIRERLWESGNMGLFNTTITDFILKNIYGFELLVVPYIICHLRIHEFLESYGFTYLGEKKERAEIYLTNTLNDAKPEVTDGFDEITGEGEEADRIKKKEEILVIMGNPPYSVSSSNNTGFIREKMEMYKHAVKKEKNIQPLSDDYIKFVRFAHWKMEQVKKGVVGIITNNSFIDGLIHRGMREELMRAFDEIYILNLHGNSRIKEKCPDGSKDENVFDILPGVCISFFVKTGKKSNKSKGVYYYNIQGIREKKYEFLYKNTIYSIKYEKLNSIKPDFWFIKRDLTVYKKYNNGLDLKSIFNIYNSGVKTHDDKNLVYFEKKNIDNEKTYHYRPFDIRWINYDLKKVVRHRFSLMKHFFYDNIGLCVGRQASVIGSGAYDIVFASDIMVDTNLFRRGGNMYSPLYLYPNENEINSDKQVDKIPNFTESFQKYIKSLYKSAPTPEQILGYIYAILYAPTYRTKYYEFLKIDFPKIPFVKDAALFKSLSDKGTELINLHLLRTHFEKPVVNFPVENPNLQVESVKFKGKQIRINKTTYFDNVPKALWEYEIGGYKVLDKWLKERKKHHYTLTGNDVRHFMNICDALNETIRIQHEIDLLVKKWI